MAAREISAAVMLLCQAGCRCERSVPVRRPISVSHSVGDVVSSLGALHGVVSVVHVGWAGRSSSSAIGAGASPPSKSLRGTRNF
eukprot:6107901-Pyramimonas_sp.AAC.1